LPAPTPRPISMSMRRLLAFAVLTAILPALTLLTPAGSPPQAPKEPEFGRLELRTGDRVCLVGNTLPERMQHDGWLEAYLHSRFPKHDLVFRNLGFSGDELTVRLRSANFGAPDHW